MKLSKNRQKRLEAIFAALDQLSGCATAQAVAKKLGINVKVVFRAFERSPKQVFVARGTGVRTVWMTTQERSRRHRSQMRSFNRFMYGTANPMHVYGVGVVDMSDRDNVAKYGGGY